MSGDVMPVLKGKSITDEDVARYFDRIIGIYFSSSLDREKYTLGEFLVKMVIDLMPDRLLQHLKGKP
jgi:hypothetical protein